ncbi:MAG: hypothetical protein KDB02_04730 [Acidimicrobiales bacterium]|nr:hypothetical protein [Acidimicrobiales bacterium]
MSAFCDLHVDFRSTAPAVTRLMQPWRRVAGEDADPWIGVAGEIEPSHVRLPGWDVWAVGPVFTYRSDDNDPLHRFAIDLQVGAAQPSALDSQAAVFAWDSRARRLHVITDRMGTVHVYRSGNDSVGTFSPAVAGSGGHRLDWIGITGFCGFGFYPGDRTALEDVRIVRPATWLLLDDRGATVSERRTWTWTFEPANRSVDETLEAFDDVWTRVLARRLRGSRAVIPLSGGLDSRTILAAATSAAVGADVRTFTYGYPGSRVETSVARRVGAARGASPLEQTVGPYLLDRFDEVFDAVEGFVGLTLPRQAGASDVIGSLGDRVVGGHWGDVWFDSIGSGSETVSPVERALTIFAKRGRSTLFDELCRPHLNGLEPEDVLRGLIADEVARLPDLGDPAMLLKALKTEQWSFRWTLAGTRAYQLGASVDLPFYADEVVDLFLTVPQRMLSGRALQVAYLRRFHPDLAAIRWQQSGTTLLDRWWERPAAKAERAVRKVSRTALRRSVLERNWEVQFLGEGRSARLESLVRPLVERDLLTKAGATEALDEFAVHPAPDKAHRIDVMVALAAVLDR